jgi:hypothetical protein
MNTEYTFVALMLISIIVSLTVSFTESFKEKTEERRKEEFFHWFSRIALISYAFIHMQYNMSGFFKKDQKYKGTQEVRGRYSVGYFHFAVGVAAIVSTIIPSDVSLMGIAFTYGTFLSTHSLFHVMSGHTDINAVGHIADFLMGAGLITSAGLFTTTQNF